jgi:hypothetical protein
MTAARYAASYGSTTDAENLAIDLANFIAQMKLTQFSSNTTTLTVDQFVQGIIQQSGTNGALNLTTPTAAAIVARIPNAQPNSYFNTIIQNTNNSTLTLIAGAGVTLSGSTPVPTNKTQSYIGIVTNATPGAEAVTVIGTLIAPT